MSDSKFRLRDFDKVKDSRRAEAAPFLAYVSAYLGKPVPSELKSEFLLEEFYRHVIESKPPVIRMEFEEDFYIEDLEPAVSTLLSTLKQYAVSVKRKFWPRRKKQKQ